MNNWLPILLMVLALLFAIAQVVREKPQRLGWIAVATFVLGIIVWSGAVSIADD